MIFKNRQAAGKLLATKLEKFFNKPNTVILGLPRGGVVVAAEVARALNLPLDIVVPRKIGAPENPEYAIGAITEHGESVWNQAEVKRIDRQWLEQKIKAEQAEAERRRKTYRGDSKPLNLIGKTVILVDDGIATGLTMKVAALSVKSQGAKFIIIAAPVGAPDSVDELKSEVQEIYILDQPTFFGAVGAFYEEFKEVSDGEVIEMMKTQEH